MFKYYFIISYIGYLKYIERTIPSHCFFFPKDFLVSLANELNVSQIKLSSKNLRYLKNINVLNGFNSLIDKLKIKISTN